MTAAPSVTALPGALTDPEAVRTIAARAATDDGVDPLSEQFLIGLTGPGPHVIATAPTPVGQAVVGYGGVVVPPSGGPGAAEVVVDPAQRGRGLGAALVSAALELAGPGATVWAHGDLPAAQSVARAVGLTAVRTLLKLSRGLAKLDPVPPVPDGVVVRTYAGAGDDAGLVAVNNAAFAWHPEQGGWGPEQIVERTTADWFDPAGLFLAVDAADPEVILGFHWTKVTNDRVGEVYIVAVAPSGQGRGLGRLLTATGLAYLADRGLADVELYVEGDNVAALNTYHRLGFVESERHVAYAQP